MASELSEDVDEMEKMLNEYLQFTKTGAKERTIKFDIVNLVSEIIGKYNNPKIKFLETDEIIFEGRKDLLKRCINNIIDNSLKYGKRIDINLKRLRKELVLKIEDDGPGIPESEIENVLKPFYKIDKSRSESKNSVGLGLSISSDIARSHGGKLQLEKSNLGGLKVNIFLPL